jgi:hypothetical protein
VWQPLSGCHDRFFLWLCSRFQEERRDTSSHIVRKCNSLRTFVAMDAARCLHQSLLQYLKMYSLATCKFVSTMWICIYCHETVYLYCFIANILECIVYVILSVAVSTTNFVTDNSILLYWHIGTGVAKCFNPSGPLNICSFVHQCNIHFLFSIIRRHVSASHGHLQVL